MRGGCNLRATRCSRPRARCRVGIRMSFSAHRSGHVAQPRHRSAFGSFVAWTIPLLQSWALAATRVPESRIPTARQRPLQIFVSKPPHFHLLLSNSRKAEFVVSPYTAISELQVQLQAVLNFGISSGTEREGLGG